MKLQRNSTMNTSNILYITVTDNRNIVFFTSWMPGGATTENWEIDTDSPTGGRLGLPPSACLFPGEAAPGFEDWPVRPSFPRVGRIGDSWSRGGGGGGGGGGLGESDFWVGGSGGGGGGGGGSRDTGFWVGAGGGGVSDFWGCVCDGGGGGGGGEKEDGWIAFSFLSTPGAWSAPPAVQDSSQRQCSSKNQNTHMYSVNES